MITQFSNKFTEKTITKLFLSPYVKILHSKSGIFVNHTATSNKFLIPKNGINLDYIFRQLVLGMEYERLLAELCKTIDKNDAEDFIAECIQNGVVE